ncbi:MAG: hypothetical protein JRJ56_06270 [Deltaproteobacteria bacterium]|nr:hypothetical protein [Deltaproteobacteria bacterium]
MTPSLPLLGQPGGLLFFTLLFTLGLQLLVGTPLLALAAGKMAGGQTRETPARWLIRAALPAICLGMTAGLPLLFSLGSRFTPLYRQSPLSFTELGTAAVGLGALTVALLFLFYLVSGKKPAAGAGLLTLLGALALLAAVQLLAIAPHLTAMTPAALAGHWLALPLFVHLLAGSPVITGLLAMLAAAYQKDYRRRLPREFYLQAFRFGGRWTLYATLAQLLTGAWVVFSLPPAARAGLLAGSRLVMLAVGLGCLVLGLLLLLKILHDNLANSRAATIVAMLLLAATLLTFIGGSRPPLPTAAPAAGPPTMETR